MRDFNREMKISNMIESVEMEANHIMEEFAQFTDGVRMLLLLQRKKDGGHNNEERRIFESYVTFGRDEFLEKLTNLLFLKRIKKDVRIYLSANDRSVKKIIREMHNALIEQYYSDDECREAICKKLIKNPRHFVMQPVTKNTAYFIIDVDDIDGQDVMGEALQEIDRLQVKEVMRYKTKNGWHIVVEPFNLVLWKSVGEVKKDPLILLSY